VTKLYVLRKNESPWGDYGDILIHGMTDGPPGGTVVLERTGPFIPPITQPYGAIVVTDAFRRELEGEGFTGFEFRGVVKKRIVKLAWEEWDRTADEPVRYPAGGEPENYVLGRKHNPAVAAWMGDLWALHVYGVPGLQIPGSKAVDLSNYNGEDICRNHPRGYTFVSERLMAWLAVHAFEWVAFEDADGVLAGDDA